MNRQFVSEVGVFSAAWHSKKAEGLIAFVKRYEHAIVSDMGNLPDKALLLKVQKLCAELDKKFPKTQPLIVERSRDDLYGGKMSKISVKPSRRDGSFSDSYWVIMTLIDVKHEFCLAHDPIKEESLQADAQPEKGGAEL